MSVRKMAQMSDPARTFSTKEFATVAGITVASVIVLIALWRHHQSAVRNHGACVMNLMAIEGAKSDWAASHGYTGQSIAQSIYEPTAEQLDSFIRKRITRGILQCPCGGTYIIGRLSELPGCTYKRPVMRWWGIRLYHRLYYWPDNPLLNKEIRRTYPQEPYVPEGTNVLSVVTVP